MRFVRLFGLVLAPLMIGVGVIFMGLTAVHAQPEPPPFDPAQIPVPPHPPIAALGQPIYLENCAPCHGLSGESDGPTVADLPSPPPPFADLVTIWGRSPAEYFHTTKFGRMAKLMPPWRNQLSDEEIWQAVFYAWSLHIDRAEFESGSSLYTAECAACHGEDGAGNGPDAEGDMPDLTDGAAMNLMTQAELSDTWRAVHPEIGQAWSPSERAAVLDVVRSFSYVPPWESGYESGDGQIQGQIVQRTAGGGDVAGSAVSLTAFVNFTMAETFQTVADEAGRFQFDNLSLDPGTVYRLDANYDDIRYSSEFIELSADAPNQEVTIDVYETGDDGSGVAISRASWVIDNEPGLLVIIQMIIAGNDLDRTFVGSSVEGVDVPVTLGVAVPQNAIDIQFQSGTLGDRFVRNGDVIYDTASIPPGQETRQIVVSYGIPYEDDSADVSMTLLHDTGLLNLLIVDLPNLEADVAGLDFSNQETIQDSLFNLYRGENIDANTAIEVSLTGLMSPDSIDPRMLAAPAGSEQEGQMPVMTTPPMRPVVPLTVGAIVLIIVIGAMVWPALKQAKVDPSVAMETEKARLIGQLADLDDRHANGELDDGAWSQERSRLKTRLLFVAQELALEPQGARR